MLEKRNLFLCKIRMICSLALYRFLYLVLFEYGECASQRASEPNVRAMRAMRAKRASHAHADCHYPSYFQRVALFDPDAFRLVTRFIAYANFFRGTSQQKMKHLYSFKKIILSTGRDQETVKCWKKGIYSYAKYA